MIAVDTSALIAILLNEEDAGRCRDTIAAQTQALIAAPTLTETLVVAMRRDLHENMERLLGDLALQLVPFSENLAYAAVRGYWQWGKGFHAAKLNYGDSFAYALAKDRSCPLLYVGNDFAHTDVISALT